MSEAIETAAKELRSVIAAAGTGLVQREVVVELVVLAAIAGEHMLVIGPPGTAKSEAVRRVAGALGGRYFEYLLGRFTEPAEIFGPVDLRKLREGVVETETSGMLPEAEIAFLDEVFLGSTAILNTLLGILNERSFRRGRTALSCPLRVCVGASNGIPSEPGLAAFADRFLVHVFLDPIADPQLEELLQNGWSLERRPPADGRGRMEALGVLMTASQEVDVAPVRGFLADALRILRQAGIDFSDRRAVKTQRLVAAAATLDQRMVATGADLWPVIFAVPDRSAQERARDLLRETLERAQNATLTHAVEAASLGPVARAMRIVEAGRQLLAAPPADSVRPQWLRKLEGVAREIDAGFAADALPADLSKLRSELVALLGPETSAVVR